MGGCLVKVNVTQGKGSPAAARCGWWNGLVFVAVAVVGEDGGGHGDGDGNEKVGQSRNSNEWKHGVFSCALSRLIAADDDDDLDQITDDIHELIPFVGWR